VLLVVLVTALQVVGPRRQPGMALIPDQGAVQEFAAASPIQRSEIAFIRGARTLRWCDRPDRP
jgi:hypothetical protein